MLSFFYWLIIIIIIYLIYCYIRSRPYELDGKTVVLTGASSGIGKGYIFDFYHNKKRNCIIFKRL